MDKEQQLHAYFCIPLNKKCMLNFSEQATCTSSYTFVLTYIYMCGLGNLLIFGRIKLKTQMDFQNIIIIPQSLGSVINLEKSALISVL